MDEEGNDMYSSTPVYAFHNIDTGAMTDYVDVDEGLGDG